MPTVFYCLNHSPAIPPKRKWLCQTVSALTGTWHIEGSRWLVSPHLIVVLMFHFDLKIFNTIIKAGKHRPSKGNCIFFSIHTSQENHAEEDSFPGTLPVGQSQGLGAPPLKHKPVATWHMKEDANHTQERLFSHHSILGHKPKIKFLKKPTTTKYTTTTKKPPT